MKKSPKKAKKSAKKTAKRTKKRASTRMSGAPRPDKAEGHAAVRKWIADVKPEHRPIVARLDALITEAVPGVKYAIKWGNPLYGLPEIGWFASTASFKEYVALVFFSGAQLSPPLPSGDGKQMRRVNIHSMEELDEKRVTTWIRQASKVKGWGQV